MTVDEEIIYDFLIELQRNKSVSEPSYQRALVRYGEQGVIDLIAIQGLYAILSMTANVARVSLPFDGAVPLRLSGLKPYLRAYRLSKGEMMQATANFSMLC